MRRYIVKMAACAGIAVAGFANDNPWFVYTGVLGVVFVLFWGPHEP